MNIVADACLLIEVDSGSINDFSRIVKRKLSDMGVETTASGLNHHISIGYLVGEIETETLKVAAAEIAKKKLCLRITGIEVLPGITTSRDYVALRISGNEELENSVNLISKISGCRQFEDGFKTHLSILSFEKGMLNENELGALARVLELQVLGLLPELGIEIQSVSIFSQHRERIARLPINPGG